MRAAAAASSQAWINSAPPTCAGSLSKPASNSISSPAFVHAARKDGLRSLSATSDTQLDHVRAGDLRVIEACALRCR